MPERTYSVKDIDRMREAVRVDLIYGYNNNLYPHMEKVSVQAVEERLRTYMIAGIDPAALEENVRAKYIK
jgi:hypothetical protein